jgi:hypothetical protein
MVDGLITPEVQEFLDREQRGGVMSADMCAAALLRLVDDKTVAGEVVTVHPSNPEGGRVEPLDPFGQFAYLGAWREDGHRDVGELVDAALKDVASGNINPWSTA